MENIRGLGPYPAKIAGAAFTAQIGFRRVKFWLADPGRTRIVQVSNLDHARILPNGHTKLVLKLQRDLLIPTSHNEATMLVKALNAVLSERHAVDLRRRESAREAAREHFLKSDRAMRLSRWRRR